MIINHDKPVFFDFEVAIGYPVWKGSSHDGKIVAENRMGEIAFSMLGISSSVNPRFGFTQNCKKKQMWYLYLQNWVIYGVNVGKYSSTMEHMGYISLYIFYISISNYNIRSKNL